MHDFERKFLDASLITSLRRPKSFFSSALTLKSSEKPCQSLCFGLTVTHTRPPID